MYDKTLGVKHARSSGVERGQLLDPICVIPRMLEKHPDFKPKIEQTVGHGLAILRRRPRGEEGRDTKCEVKFIIGSSVSARSEAQVQVWQHAPLLLLSGQRCQGERIDPQPTQSL